MKKACHLEVYNFRVLIHLCDDISFFLAEDFYWYNPSKLPSPIEWVNKRKIRAKDSVNTVWCFSKTEWPKADVTKVLVKYSDRIKNLSRTQKLIILLKNDHQGIILVVDLVKIMAELYYQIFCRFLIQSLIASILLHVSN